MIRLIASDMDRTLLDENARIPEETYGLIRELRKVGVHFCVCSGRPTNFLLDLWQEALGEIDIVCSNGSQVFVDGELVSHTPYPRADVERLARVLERYDDLHADMYAADGRDYGLDVPGSAKAQRFLDNFAWIPGTVVGMPAEDVDITAGAIVSEDTASDMRAPAASLAEELGDAFQFLPLGTNVMDVVPRGISKATGLQQVMDIHGVTRDEVAGYGDSMNDIDFLRHVGHPVAVSNAFPEVKAIAERIIESNVEHGVQRDMARILGEWRSLAEGGTA